MALLGLSLVAAGGDCLLRLLIVVASLVARAQGLGTTGLSSLAPGSRVQAQ